VGGWARVGALRGSTVGTKSRRTTRDPVYSAVHELHAAADGVPAEEGGNDRYGKPLRRRKRWTTRYRGSQIRLTRPRSRPRDFLRYLFSRGNVRQSAFSVSCRCLVKADSMMIGRRLVLDVDDAERTRGKGRISQVGRSERGRRESGYFSSIVEKDDVASSRQTYAS